MSDTHVFIITGDDEFLRKRRSLEIAAQVAGCAPEESPDVEIINGDGEANTEDVLSEFLLSWRTPPFLSARKILWLRHFESFTALAETTVGEEVADALTGPQEESVFVIMDAPGLDMRTSFAKKLAKNAMIENCAKAKLTDRNYAANRQQEIGKYLADRNKEIDSGASRFIAEAIGGGDGSGNLINELEKLISYVGDAPRITLQDALAVISRTPEAMSWNYLNSVHEGKLEDALIQLNVILSEPGGGADLRLIAAISNDYQRIIQTILDMEELGVSRLNPNTFKYIDEETKQAHPDNQLLKMHPFRAFKVCETATALPPETLAGNLKSIRTANTELVSGGDPRFVLERLTRELTLTNHR